METLKEAVAHVLDLKGSIVALEEDISALLLATPPAQRVHGSEATPPTGLSTGTS